MQVTYCNSSIMYVASLNGSDIIKVNRTMCGVSVCSASFEVESDMSITIHQLTLFTMNSIGSSDLVKYPISIGT